MTQTLTPELQHWVDDQISAGHSRPELLQSMILNGWDAAVASRALRASTARPPAQARAAAPAAAGAASDRPPRLKVPRLALDGAPLFLDGGDRQVAVLGNLANPAITILGGLLSDEECEALIEAARPAMKRSAVLDMATGASQVTDVRTSNGMFFQRGQNAVVARVEARLARLCGWPVENGEGIQVLQYGPGAEYRPHYDYFDPREPGTPTILQRGGHRVATIVMYLSEPARGGGTVFPDVGLEVGPRRGNAVFFSYDIPHPDSRTLHGGSPVQEGEKWIATKWLREREFASPAGKPPA
ncbi:MAG: 2OG-Fe(II) oxygenase [Ramlibacter sp.]